jgi:Flp pilus assembly protein TadG
MNDDDGRAVIEFVFLGVLTLVPLLYLVVAVTTFERNVFAATQAAREAGRAYATSDDPVTAEARAAYSANLALSDQGVSPGQRTLKYVPVSADCASGAAGAQSLDPGAEFAVCVIQPVRIPGVPGLLDSRANTVTGRYVVHVDDFRASR